MLTLILRLNASICKFMIDSGGFRKTHPGPRRLHLLKEAAFAGSVLSGDVSSESVMR